MNLLCKHNTQEHASSTPLHRGSSSVSIQSDRVTLLPMHTSRTQAAPPCAVWETPPKRALPVHQKGGRRPQMVEQGAGPCEQDTSHGPARAFCTML